MDRCFNVLTLNMFVNKKSPNKNFPYLKGKAAEIREIGPALLHVFSAFMDRGNAQHRRMHLALRLSCKMEEIIREHKGCFTLGPEAAADLTKAARDFVQLNTALASHYNQQGLKIFDVTIKFHYLVHAAHNSRYLSPGLSWCYAGEDMMQYMKKSIRAVPGERRDGWFLGRLCISMPQAWVCGCRTAGCGSGFDSRG